MLGNGATTHRLVKVSDHRLPIWDGTHDTIGRKLDCVASNSKSGVEDFEN